MLKQRTLCIQIMNKIKIYRNYKYRTFIYQVKHSAVRRPTCYSVAPDVVFKFSQILQANS